MIRTEGKIEAACACSGFVRETQDIYCPLVHTQKHCSASRDPHGSRYDTSKQRGEPLRQIYLPKSAERRQVSRVRRILGRVKGDISEEKSVNLTRRSSITRVFKTSSGVVRAAAMPPAALPHNEASYGRKEEDLL